MWLQPNKLISGDWGFNDDKVRTCTLLVATEDGSVSVLEAVTQSWQLVYYQHDSFLNHVLFLVDIQDIMILAMARSPYVLPECCAHACNPSSYSPKGGVLFL